MAEEVIEQVASPEIKEETKVVTDKKKFFKQHNKNKKKVCLFCQEKKAIDYKEDE